ncbi:hypothetical protein [Streptomyces sp. NPDC055085]
MTAAAADPWWADWPKFLPGWLAFVWTLGLGARKVWVRRHHVALGPAADELRDTLETARTRFEDIISAGGRRADWFEDEERRDTDRKIEGLADRLKDAKLSTALTGVIAACRSAFGTRRHPASSLATWTATPRGQRVNRRRMRHGSPYRSRLPKQASRMSGRLSAA